MLVDQLAAKHPDVVDYCLHGGRQRIAHIYNEVMALFAADQAGGDLEVPAMTERLQKALGALSHDPHYRYEHR